MKPSRISRLAMSEKHDAPRYALYVLVALATFVAGLMLGAAGRNSSGGSRVDWPQPAHPRRIFSP